MHGSNVHTKKRQSRYPRKTRHRAAARGHRANKQAIIRIPAPPNRPWELKSEEIELVKNALCKGATDAELAFCLATARRYRLDPFRGQIWFVPRNDYQNKTKSWVPIVGINGLLHIAARDHHADFGSVDEPEFGKLVEVKYRKKGQGPELKIKAPEWARVSVWKKGHQHP